MPKSTFIEIPAEEQARMLATLRRARYGYLLALHIMLWCADGRKPLEIAVVLFCSRSSVYRADKAPQCTACNALSEHHVPEILHADDAKHPCRDVDAEYAHVLCHGTRLLWVNGCRRCRHHSGSLKPHWKEAGPFH
jgi:hypothetical protein